MVRRLIHKVATPSCRAMSLQGFTLVELVMCIVIAGILTAVAAPKLLDDLPFKERSYVDQVASALRYSRQIAMSTECDVSFAIDAAGGYSASQRTLNPATNTCNTAGAFTVSVRSGDGLAVAATPPSGIGITPQRNIIFDGQGRASAGPDLAIGGFTLAVDQESGWVTVSP